MRKDRAERGRRGRPRRDASLRDRRRTWRALALLRDPGRRLDVPPQPGPPRRARARPSAACVASP